MKPLVPPKLPQRTFEKREEHDIAVNNGESLAALIARLPEGVTPADVEVYSYEESDYDWSVSEVRLRYYTTRTVTMSDKQWAYAMRRYEAANQRYLVKVGIALP